MAPLASVLRIERTRLVAGLVAWCQDLDLAEDLAQEAILAALAAWPPGALPPNPGAWLMTTAKRKGIDLFRRERSLAGKLPLLAEALDEAQAKAEALAAQALEQEVEDEVLALIFLACHPALRPGDQVALTLKLIGGLTTAEVARAFLVSEATMAQRLVRAKARLRAQAGALAPPEADERAARLGSVLATLYLIFTEGHAATAGPRLVRPELCAEALRLARILVGLVPQVAEAWGLLALMALQASRLATRQGPDGGFVSLTEQDRSRWDRLLIEQGLAALARAEALGGADGPYALQAALGACHARARRAEDTDWRAICALYQRLDPSGQDPIVALNLAIATGMAEGPEAGLALLAALPQVERLQGHAPWPAAEGELRLRAGQPAAAQAAFERAAAWTANEAEAAHLRRRAAACLALAQAAEGG